MLGGVAKHDVVMRKICHLLLWGCLTIWGLQQVFGDNWPRSYLWFRPDAAYIQETNKKREAIGLRLIDTNWIFGGNKFDMEIWVKSPDGSRIKTIVRGKNNDVVEDVDFYYSGMTYTNGDGTFTEKLVFSYTYTNKCVQLSYWGTNSLFEKMVQPFRTDNTNFNAAAEVTDKILKEWKMSRL